jgi:hypothetical protein
MTGLEPHPILRLPTQQEALAMGKARFAQLCEMRAQRLIDEQTDPLNKGYRPPIWHVADELLVDGKEVILVDPSWDIEDPALRRRRPPDFLAEADRRKREGLGPIIIIGRRELWIAGSNRSSKTEYAAFKLNETGARIPHGRTWSWSDSEEKSRAKQHPIVFKYLPREWKDLLNSKGKAKSTEMKIGYGPDGFIGNKFSVPNGWKHWFNNYKQDLRDVEGDQINMSWHDEERDPERLKTVRVRLGDRRGILLVTFTSIDATFMAIVTEYETGMRILLEVDAEWLPIKRAGTTTPFEKEPGMSYEKVRRVAIAGPGSDGDQQANILYFHISDNPYYGYDPHQVIQPGEPPPIYGKRAFYINQNIANATKPKILSRAYGILQRGAYQQFRFNSAIHVLDPSRIPAQGSRYLIVDPCPGRNWFMIWILIDPLGRWFIYREWPSYGGNWASAYIPGIGDPGPWALPGATSPTGKIVYDGRRGAAQNPFGFGLSRYKEEILRCEGHAPNRNTEDVRPPEPVRRPTHKDRFAGKHDKRALALKSAREAEEAPPRPRGPEIIQERWLDARYAGSPTIQKEAPTTQIEQLTEIGLDFRAAPSEQNILTRDDGSISMINELLDYDTEVELGEFSPRLARTNEPLLFVSSECPNVAFSLKEWTGKDGQHGACKDPADTVRYGRLSGIDYVGDGAYAWQGGGSY